MQIDHIIADMVKAGIEGAISAELLPHFTLPPIDVQTPRDTSKGDYACPVAMRLAKPCKMPPLKIAEAIASQLTASDQISEFSVAPPGFINFRLSEKYLQETIKLMAEPAFGSISVGADKKAQIEFVSANPTGPITIGRTRGGVIGDTLARLMEAAGYTVTREYYYNDAGRQIRLLGEAVKIRYLQTLGFPDKLSDEHYQGDYVIEIAQQLKKEHNDGLIDTETDWFSDHAKETIRAQQMASLERIGITHDVYFNEASLYQDGSLDLTLETLSQNGYLYEKDGAQWLKTTALGDDKDVVAVRSGDGLPTYRVPDIAYHKNKAERGFDIVVDIFGSDHHEVAKEVLLGVQMLGYDTSFVHTLIHQFVTLQRDGEEVRMSTRRGVYETLDDLVDEVGPDPVRYFMLGRHANSSIKFDLDLAIENSDKNPVYYIQNAHVRCAGIQRKWQESGHDLSASTDADLSLLTHPLELAFIKKALELSTVIEQSVTNYEPHHIAFYAMELAGAFHPLYDACRVMGEGISPELSHARLAFYQSAQALFARVLTLMGMSAPDRM